jgi:outer membrane protein OmpA-like peptidoglycan-associated protein
MVRHVSLRRGVAVALAAVLGLLMAQVLPRASVATPSVLGALPGRHLQTPWWEAISYHMDSPDSVSYTVPAEVLFSTNSSTISGAGQGVLRALVPQLRGAASIIIAGCTDSVGGVDSPSNIALSEQRAVAAQDILESSGLNPALFHILAWADTHPVSGMQGLDPATINALNRRIVIIVTWEGQA